MEYSQYLNSKIIGIDLGTTNTCVAVAKRNRIEIVQNDRRKRTFPSMVCFTGEGVEVGHGAKSAEKRHPMHTVFEIKRIIGSKCSDETTQEQIKQWPFTVINGDGGNPAISVTWNDTTRTYFPEEICGFIIQRAKKIAEDFLGHDVTEAVITVPAYFNNNQRQATKDAGEIAGLKVRKIINEPTAAALAFGWENWKDEERTVLVYDLGGGTFDVSIMKIKGKTFDVKATGGDTHLGGIDFNLTLMSYFLKKCEEKCDINLSNDEIALRRIREKCEKIKRKLSFEKKYHVELNLLSKNKSKLVDVELDITREEFEKINMHQFKKTIDTIDDCLKDAGMTKDDITDIVLVGGSTYIPKVQELLKEHMPRSNLLNTVNPDEAVAYGAAIQAVLIDNDEFSKVIKINDVTPLSLGTNLNTGEMSVVIKRNTPIPCTIKKSYCTAEDKQSVLINKIYQGERLLARENALLGTCTINQLPLRPKGKVTILTTFSIDTNGILNVQSAVEGTQLKSSVNITLEENRLSPKKIRRLIKISNEKKEEDIRCIKLNKCKDSLQLYCNVTLAKASLNEKKLGSQNYKLIYETCNNAIVRTKKFEYRFEIEDLLEEIQSVCEPLIQQLP